MDNLQEQLEIGKQAEDFKNYIDEHPYFNGLLERVRMEYARMIFDLDSTQKDEFTRYKQSMEAVGQILNSISGDIYLGQQAYEKLNGISEEPKGLL